MIKTPPGDEGGIDCIPEAEGLKIYACSSKQARIFWSCFRKGQHPDKAVEFFNEAPQEAYKEVGSRFRKPKTREGIARDLTRLKDDDECDRSRHPDVFAGIMCGIRRVADGDRHRVRNDEGIRVECPSVQLTPAMECHLSTGKDEKDITDARLAIKQKLNQLDAFTYEIGMLHVKGMSVSQIAELTGWDGKRVYRHIALFRDACLEAQRE